MSDAKLCDRCGAQFGGWRPVTREFILQQDVLKSSMTPTIRHKAVDLCPDCDVSLTEWYRDGGDDE